MRLKRINYRYYAMVVSQARHQWSEADDAWQAKASLPVAQSWIRPAADVFENDDYLAITVEIPGINPDQLAIILYDDALIIESERNLLPPANEGVYHRAEIKQGTFRLELELQHDIMAGKITSHYEHGLLTVVIIKTKEETHG